MYLADSATVLKQLAADKNQHIPCRVAPVGNQTAKIGRIVCAPASLAIKHVLATDKRALEADDFFGLCFLRFQRRTAGALLMGAGKIHNRCICKQRRRSCLRDKLLIELA
jgi:hypothetical protein